MDQKTVPSTIQLLRRWCVAGLAAALALAWTISSLVSPSTAYGGQDSIPGQNASIKIGDPASGGGLDSSVKYEVKRYGSRAEVKDLRNVLDEALKSTQFKSVQTLLGKYFSAQIKNSKGTTLATASGYAANATMTANGKDYTAMCIDPGGASPWQKAYANRGGNSYSVSSVINYARAPKELSSSQKSELSAIAYKFSKVFGKDIASYNVDALFNKTKVARLDTDFQNVVTAAFASYLAAWSLGGQADINQTVVQWGKITDPILQQLLPRAEQVQSRVIQMANAMINISKAAQIAIPGSVYGGTIGAAGSSSANASVGHAGFDAAGNFVVTYQLTGPSNLRGREATLNISGMPQGGTLIDNTTAHYLQNGSKVTLPASVTLTLPKAKASFYTQVRISATVAGQQPVQSEVRFPIDITGTPGTRARVTVDGLPADGRLVDALGHQISNGTEVDVPSRIYAIVPGGTQGALRVKLSQVNGENTTRAAVAVMEQSREVDSRGDMYVRVGISGYDQNNQATLRVTGVGGNITLNKVDQKRDGSYSLGESVGNGSKVELPSTLVLKVPAGASAGQVSIGASTSAESSGSVVGHVLAPSQAMAQWLLVIDGPDAGSSSSEANAQITVSWTPRPRPSEDTPAIGTQLTATKDGKENLKSIELTALDSSKTFDLVDKVTLTNLKENKTYRLQGWLTDRNGQRANGSPDLSYNITRDDIQRGYALVPFKVTGEFLLRNKTVTAYEELYEYSTLRPVAEHKKPNDPDQTITITERPVPKNPHISTQAWVVEQAEGTGTGVKTAEPGKPVHVNDVVSYVDLNERETYTAIAQLIEVRNDRVVASGSTTFVPERASGTVNVPLSLDSPKANTDYVVYEALYRGSWNHTNNQPAPNNQPVATHREKSDPNQTIRVTEEKPKPAQFKIIKTVSGTAIPAGDKTFNFDIRCGSVNKSAQVIVRNGQTQGEAVVTGLQTGQSCTVTETNQLNADAYSMTPTFSSSSRGVEIAPNGQSATVVLDKSNAQTVELKVDNNYRHNLGKFQVKKVVSLNGQVSNVPRQFTFSYNCGTAWQSLGTLINGQTSREITAPVGTRCQVREDSVASDTVNNQVSWENAESFNGNTATIVVGKTGTVLLTAVNTISPKTGQFKLVKRVADLTTGATLPRTFKLHYVCEVDGTKVKEGTENVAANGEVIVSGIPAGALCAVNEDTSNATVAGTKLVVKFNDQNPTSQNIGGTVLDQASPKVMVQANQTVEVVANNTYTEEKAAGFAVTKRVSGVTGTAADELANKQFKFNYTCTLPDAARIKAGSFQLKNGETFSSTTDPELRNLPVGTNCELWESQVSEFTNMNYEGVTWFKQSLSDNAEVTMPAGQGEHLRFTLRDKNTVVSFAATNTYRKQLGGLTLTKQQIGTAPAGLNKFNFRVTCGQDVQDISLVAGGTWHRWGIPVGTRCTIEEVGAQKADGSPINLSDSRARHSIQWQGTENDQSTATTNTVVISEESAREATLAGTAGAKVTAKNNYEEIPQFGKFKITKQSVTVPGDDNNVIKVPGTFDFHYECTTGEKGDLNGIAKGQSKESPQLPVGSQCTITEVGSLPQGANAQRVTWSVNGQGTGMGDVSATTAQVTIGDNTVVEVVADNQYSIPGKPSIGTSLKSDSGQKLKVNEKTEGTFVLTDRISYNNLIVGQTYKFSGRLMVVDEQGQAHESDIPAQESTMIAKASSGVHEVKFTVTADQLRKYSKLVAFEKLAVLVEGEYKPVTEHEDPNDPNQSIPVEPWLKTTLTGTDQQKAISTAGLADEAVITLHDKVEYHNLKVGQKYYIVGRLVNGQGQNVGVYGHGETFVPESENGYVTMSFSVPVSVIRANEKLVAYEYLFTGEVPERPTVPGGPDEPSVPPVGEHEDPDDPNQTIKEGPRLGTVASAADGSKEVTVSAKSTTVVKDRVDWFNLTEGAYTLVGQLMDKKTHRAVSGVEVTPVEFGVEKGARQGTVEMIFNLPANAVSEDSQFVVFERVYKRDDVVGGKVKESAKPVVSHEDIEDQGQTVTVKPAPKVPVLKLSKQIKPNTSLKIPTSKGFKFILSCTVNGTPQADKEITVKGDGVPVNLPYIEGAECRLVEDTASGRFEEFTPTVTVTPEASGAEASALNSENIAGGIKFHMPERSASETSFVFRALNEYPTPNQPAIGTSLSYLKDAKADQPVPSGTRAAGEKEVALSVADADKEFVLVDVVDLSGLRSSKSYQLHATLVDSKGERIVGVEPVIYDVTSADVEAGYANVPFKVTGKVLLAHTSFVAFEELHVKGDTTGNPVAEHKIVKDSKQTVKVREVPPPLNPSLVTKASVFKRGEADVTGSVVEAGEAIKVRDVLTYTDLAPETDYTIVSKLFELDASGNPADQTKPVLTELSQVRTPAAIGDKKYAVSGEFSIDFTNAFEPKAGKVYVAYERVYKGKLSAEQATGDGEAFVIGHEVPNDKAQQVSVVAEQPKPAKFKIVKTVDGDARPDGDLVFDFQAQCTNSTKTVQVRVPAGQPSGEAWVEGLVTGESCTVTETSKHDAVGHKVSTTFASQSHGVTVAEDKQSAVVVLDKSNAQTVELNVKNSFNPVKGRFQVKKTVTNSGAVVAAPNSFRFEYKCGADTEWKSLGELAAGQTSHAVEVTAGTVCQVREQQASNATVNSTVTWSGNGVETIKSEGYDVARFTVAAGQDANLQISALNTLTPKTGKIRLTKHVTNGTNGNVPSLFAVDYKCFSGEREVKSGRVSVGANQTVEITDIPAGAQCYLAEDGTTARIDNANLTVTYGNNTGSDRVAGKEISLPAGGELVNGYGPVQIGADVDVALTVDNSYVPQKAGGFQIFKAASGTGKDLVKDQSFQFAYECKVPGLEKAPVTGEFSLKPGETWSSTAHLNDLPVGSECSVQEKVPVSADNRTYEGVTWFKNTVGGNTRTEDIPADSAKGYAGGVKFRLGDTGQVVKFTATNKFSQVLGGLKLVKEVTGKPASGMGAYVFDLTCDNGFRKENVAIPVHGGSHSWWGIPVGTACTVTERGAQGIDGSPIALSDRQTSHALTWEGEGEAAGGNAYKVLINKGQTLEEFNQSGANITVKAKNAFTPNRLFGGFEVTKRKAEVVSDNPNRIELPTSYTFKYTCGAVNGTLQVGVGETKKVENLPAGTECSITEVSQLPTGVTGQTVAWTLDGNGAGVGQPETTPLSFRIGDAKTIAVVADNTYTVPDKPSIKTQLTSNGGMVDVKPDSQGRYILTDKISYQNLVVGQTYRFDGELMFISGEGEPVATGIKASRDVTIATVNGVVEMDFVLTAKDMVEYSKLVAYEKAGLLVNGKVIPVTEHEDPDDPNQTKPGKPWIGTTLTGKDGQKQISTQGLKDSDLIEVVDRVDYKNLVPGKQYHLVGKLVDGSGREIGVSGMSQTFVPAGKPGTFVSGTTEMRFQVPVQLIRSNAKIVAYEYLYDGPTPTVPEDPTDPSVPPVAEHEDPDDPNQTVEEAPRVGTQAMNGQGTKEFVAGQPGVIDDIVKWDAFVPGKYTVIGTLMDKGTGKPVPGTSAAPVDFQVAPGILSGQVRVVFNVPAEAMQSGKQFVVFEKVYRAGDVANRRPDDGAKPVGEHSDLNDPDQTVKVIEPVKPVLKTLAANAKPTNHESGENTLANGQKVRSEALLWAGEDATIQDKISWTGLPAGDYVVYTKLVTPGEPPINVLDWRETKQFTVAEGVTNGTVGTQLQISGDSIQANTTYVVFERIYRAQDVSDENVAPETGVIGSHEDPLDKAQSLYAVERPSLAPPSLFLAKVVDGLDAKGKEFKFSLSCAPAAGAEGTVEVNGLVIEDIVVREGAEAVQLRDVPAGVECRLVEKVDESVSRIDGYSLMSTGFTVENPNVRFSVDSDAHALTFVLPQAESADAVIKFTATNVYDKPQAEPPTLKTLAKNSKDGSKVLQPNEPAKVADTVSYTNLEAGKDYVLRGWMVDKASMRPVTAPVCVPFKPEGEAGTLVKSGTVEVGFEIARDLVRNDRSFVAYEFLYEKEQMKPGECEPVEGTRPVAEHADVNDPGQTVSVPPAPPTTPPTPPVPPTTPPTNPPVPPTNPPTDPPVPPVPPVDVPPVPPTVPYLPKTGTTGLILGMTGLLALLAGSGLILTRRYQRQEQE